MNYQYYQVGGAKCSLCGSDGTNKSTCPLNPEAVHPNHKKHPNAAAMIKATLSTVATPASSSSPSPSTALSKDEIDKINALIKRIKNVKSKKYDWKLQLPEYNLKDSDLLNKELYVIAPPKYDSLTKINVEDYKFEKSNDGEIYSTYRDDYNDYFRNIWLVYRPGLLQRLETFFPAWKEKNKYDVPKNIEEIEELLKKLNSVSVTNPKYKHWLDLLKERWGSSIPPNFLKMNIVNSENFDGLYGIGPPYTTYKLIDKNTSFSPDPRNPKIATTNKRDNDVWLVQIAGREDLQDTLISILKEWVNTNKDTNYEKKLLGSFKPKKYKFVKDLDTDELLYPDRDYLNVKVSKDGEPITSRYTDVIEVPKKDLSILELYSIKNLNSKDIILNKETAPILLSLINHKWSKDPAGKYYVNVINRYILQFELPE